MLLVGVVIIFFYGTVVQAVPARVVGGHDAPNHKYPYQASLRYINDQHFCSGSVLNKQWILTAAHCINKIDTTNYTISVGTNFLNESGDRYSVQFHIVHENYESYSQYDIALIRVVEKITFNDFVKTIQLAQSNFYNDSLNVEFAGWGSTEYGFPMSNNLQEIELRLISMKECRVWYPDVTSNHLCTFNKIGEGVCHGDSGGPLTSDGIQIGIVSYIIPCAVGGPDVYTRIWSYRNWINSTINRLDDNVE